MRIDDVTLPLKAVVDNRILISVFSIFLFQPVKITIRDLEMVSWGLESVFLIQWFRYNNAGLMVSLHPLPLLPSYNLNFTYLSDTSLQSGRPSRQTIHNFKQLNTRFQAVGAA